MSLPTELIQYVLRTEYRAFPRMSNSKDSGRVGFTFRNWPQKSSHVPLFPLYPTGHSGQCRFSVGGGHTGQEHKQEASEATLETGYGSLSISLLMAQWRCHSVLLLIHMAQAMPTEEMLALSSCCSLFQSGIE